MTSVNLQQWIQHPETLDRDTLYELRTLVARYPYFQSLRLLYLKNLYILHDISFGIELRKAIIYIADRRKLFQLIEGDRYTLQSRKKSLEFTQESEDEPSVDRTLTLINAFLTTVPDELTSQTDLDYSTDYTAYLLREDTSTDENVFSADTPKLYGQEWIDNFIENNSNESLLPIQTSLEEALPEDETVTIHTKGKSDSEVVDSESISAAEEEDDSCFTETLAKIYIKQQRYSKALEIIKKLSLKYPKKNAYFADQIRFLEKLIINANSK